MVAPNETRARDLTRGLIPCAGSRDVYHRPERVAACAACRSREPVGTDPSSVPGAGEREAGFDSPARPTPSRPRPGEATEAALYAAFDGEPGWYDIDDIPEDNDLESYDVPRIWIRQYPWGAYLSPPRRFSSDAAFPVARVLVEVEGQVHSIKGKRKGDILRRQLAEANGWRVVSLLPEQVRDGSAIALVRGALECASRTDRYSARPTTSEDRA